MKWQGVILAPPIQHMRFEVTPLKVPSWPLKICLAPHALKPCRRACMADRKRNVALRAVDFRIPFTFFRESKFFLQIIGKTLLSFRHIVVTKYRKLYQ